MKKTFRIVFFVDGETCAEYKDLVDKFMLKQMELAEDFVKTADQDEILKQSSMAISMDNDFYTFGDYERCTLYFNEKGKEYLDASNNDEALSPSIYFRGSSGFTKEEWDEYMKESRERWEEIKGRHRETN